jgi:hypothetical protein
MGGGCVVPAMRQPKLQRHRPSHDTHHYSVLEANSYPAAPSIAPLRERIRAEIGWNRLRPPKSFADLNRPLVFAGIRLRRQIALPRAALLYRVVSIGNEMHRIKDHCSEPITGADQNES